MRDCRWSPDSKQFLTTSADRTAKLWNIDGTIVKYGPVTFNPCSYVVRFGRTFKPSAKTDVEDMLMGALWHGQHFLLISSCVCC